jgi:hypothetical protein
LTEEEVEMEILGECKTLSQLNHPNIIKLMGIAIEEGGAKGIVTELIYPGSLELLLYDPHWKSEMRRLYDFNGRRGDRKTREIPLSSPLPELFILEVLIGIYQGLDYLHREANMFLHRDLKAADILVELCPPRDTRAGLIKRVLLGDFEGRRPSLTIEPKPTSISHVEMKTEAVNADLLSIGLLAMEMCLGRPLVEIPAENSLGRRLFGPFLSTADSPAQQRKAQSKAMRYPEIRKKIVKPSLFGLGNGRYSARGLLNACRSIRTHILSELASLARMTKECDESRMLWWERLYHLAHLSVKNEITAGEIACEMCHCLARSPAFNLGKQGVIEALLSAMIVYPSATVLIESALLSLTFLSESKENAIRIGVMGGIGIILSGLKTRPSFSANLLSSLVRASEDHRTQLLQNGECLEFLIAKITRPSGPVFEFGNTCQAFLQLVASDEDVIYRAYQAGVIEATLQTVGHHSSICEYLISGCEILIKVGFVKEEATARLIDKGAIELMVAACKRFRGSENAQSSAFAVLSRIARSSTEARIRIRKAGGIEAIVDGLKSKRHSRSLQINACAALYNLANSNLTNRNRIKKAGGVEIISVLLKASPSDPQLQEWGQLLQQILAK